MGSHVQVILKDDVDHLGHVGEVVRVRAGYARNYLVPRGLAVAATSGSIKQIEHEMKLAQAKAAEVRAAAETIATTLGKLSLSVEKKAGASGKLYGSVTSSDVAEALAAAGHEVDRKKLVLPTESIKQAGSYEIGVTLGGGVRANFNLDVVAEAGTEEATAASKAPETVEEEASEAEASEEVSESAES